MQENMYAAVLAEYKKIEWKEIEIPEISDDEALVQVSYASICGSDQHIYKGEFHPRTRLPLIPGHEFCGKIVKTGKQVQGFDVGDRVVVDPIYWCKDCTACSMGHYLACSSLKLIGVDTHGGFGQYVKVKNFMLFHVPDTIIEEHASLIELYSIGYHACKRAGVKAGDTIAIWGGGRVGHSVLQAARTKTENTIFLIDILEKRLNIADIHYKNVVTINPGKEDPLKIINEITKSRGVDIAFETVGHAICIPDRFNPVRSCIKSIRGAGIVCVLGLSDVPAELLMKELIWKEAKLIASRVNCGEFPEVIDNLVKGTLFPDAIISKILPVQKTDEAFQLLESDPGTYLKILLKVT